MFGSGGLEKVSCPVRNAEARNEKFRRMRLIGLPASPFELPGDLSAQPDSTSPGVRRPSWPEHDGDNIPWRFLNFDLEARSRREDNGQTGNRDTDRKKPGPTTMFISQPPISEPPIPLRWASTVHARCSRFPRFSPISLPLTVVNDIARGPIAKPFLRASQFQRRGARIAR